MTNPSHVDLAFPVRGQVVPRDHGYQLYGAISRAIPGIHGANWVAVHGIAGTLLGPDVLGLQPSGWLRVRVPADRIPTLLPLAGSQLEIGGHVVFVGVPSVHALTPAPLLDARLVVIRFTGGLRPGGAAFDREAFDRRFIAEAERQLARLGVSGTIELCGHRSIHVGGQRVIGHSVRVGGLSPDHSILLQASGLGGKRTMGCGIFRPSRPLRGPHVLPNAVAGAGGEG